jgi:hypothetical protein
MVEVLEVVEVVEVVKEEAPRAVTEVMQWAAARHQ